MNKDIYAYLRNLSELEFDSLVLACVHERIRRENIRTTQVSSTKEVKK